MVEAPWLVFCLSGLLCGCFVSLPMCFPVWQLAFHPKAFHQARRFEVEPPPPTSFIRQLYPRFCHATCFILCGATCAAPSDYEEHWGHAAVEVGIAHKWMVFAPPPDVFGDGWDHWWCRYDPLEHENFNDTLNATACAEDIASAVASTGLGSAIEAERAKGHGLAFIGASNGGHAALHPASKYGAEWLLLASSVPLTQQMHLCHSLRKPLVMTVCAKDRYFGGCDASWSVARAAGAFAVWVDNASHCHEDWFAQLRATTVIRDWLGSLD